MNTDPIHFSVGLACYATGSDFPIPPFEQQILLLSRAYGVDACVFSPLSIDCTLSSPEVPVQYWDGTAFRQAVAPVPKILDCRFGLLKKKAYAWLQPERHRWLLEHSTFSDYYAIPKEKLSQLLMCSPLYDLAIPTYRVTEYEQLLRLAKMLQHCIVKPSGGYKGRHVCRVDYDGVSLTKETLEGTEKLTQEQWAKYLDLLANEEMGQPLLQPRLDFSLNDEHAVDFRLLVAHGGSGTWEEVAIYSRVGATKLVSNISGGGSFADAESVLSAIAGTEADKLLDRLHHIAAELPVFIQRQVERPITCLGIDVGIDRKTLDPYVLEANTFPGSKYHSWQLAHKRVQYYQYLLRNMK